MTAGPPPNRAHWLKPVVYSIAALASVVLGLATWQAWPGWQPGWQPALLVLFGALLHYAEINGRIRASTFSLAPTSVAALVCVIYAAPSAAVAYGFAGALIGKWLFKRQPAIKAIFNAAKETLAVAAAVVVAHGLGFVPISVGAENRASTLADAIAICVAAAAYAITEEALMYPVLSIAGGVRVRHMFMANIDIRLLVRLGALAAAIAMYLILLESDALLLAMPVLVYGIHLATAMRIRTRSERETWQRLSRATDEFNSVDFDGVLRTAVLRAAELFSVHEVEVEVLDPPRLVRGDANDVLYDGPPSDAPPTTGQAIGMELTASSDVASIGELRLLIRGQITLSERENYTLATFAAALRTAIRNATTYTETKRLAESHARAAAIDPLTDLGNRRKLTEYGEQVLAARPPNGVTALLLIDLNHFKEINDTLGHSAGDQVLVVAAQRLKATAQPDDLVARLGGDEFAILLVGLPAPALALARAHALLACLNPPMEVDGVRVSVEASGGVAVATSDGTGKRTVEELLRRADVAMYQAKRNGQRVVTFEQSRDTADVKQLSLGGEISRAIAQKEFVVNFQPIVDLGTGDAVGAEALTRWAHPQHGNLTPNRFLDSVERSGQLAAFAEEVLDQALCAVTEWSEAGFEMPVSVNVTPRSLLDAAFPDMVERQLSGREELASRLVIELTESVTLSQLEVVDDVLGRLRALGLQLALDDFGTGYSSLATLARVPVQELKIDRSFVAAMDAPVEAAVVRSTIELGRSLGLSVVAEGVETERQRAKLWEYGCPLAQGHLFAKPMTLPKLMTLLRTGPGGKPGRLAEPLHETGSVIRIHPSRRARGGQQAADGS